MSPQQSSGLWYGIFTHVGEKDKVEKSKKIKKLKIKLKKKTWKKSLSFEVSKMNSCNNHQLFLFPFISIERSKFE